MKRCHLAAALVAAALSFGWVGRATAADPGSAQAQRAEAEAQVKAYDRQLQDLQQLRQKTAALGVSTAAVDQKIKQVQGYRGQWAQRLARPGGGTRGGAGAGAISILGVTSQSPLPTPRR
jgi:hypothetical protein